ncbi:hypothetical protein RJ639_031476, partial [Escallonia herrerae]
MTHRDPQRATRTEKHIKGPSLKPKTLRTSLLPEIRRPATALSPPYISGQMVYMTTWDDFVDKSVQLFRANPEKTRYCTKYRHCDGKLVLKVTDDKECIKFKTDQAQDAKKMEKLNNIFFTLMARGPE